VWKPGKAKCGARPVGSRIRKGNFLRWVYTRCSRHNGYMEGNW